MGSCEVSQLIRKIANKNIFSTKYYSFKKYDERQLYSFNFLNIGSNEMQHIKILQLMHLD